MRSDLKPIKGGEQLVAYGTARPRNPDGGRPSLELIAAEVGQVIAELVPLCPDGYAPKRITARRDASRKDRPRGWRFSVQVIFERDTQTQRPGPHEGGIE